jgi:type II secretion system protein I
VKRFPWHTPAQSRAGFTLLEVIVALAILGTGVVAALGILATGTSVTARASTRLLATELAESRMEETLLRPADARAREEGSFPPPYDDFRWRTRVGPGPVDGTMSVEVSVLGNGDSVHLATLRRR